MRRIYSCEKWFLIIVVRLWEVFVGDLKKSSSINSDIANILDHP